MDYSNESICPICGCAVIDKETHTEYHLRMERVYALKTDIDDLKDEINKTGIHSDQW